ncbi:hypothetical protein [Marinomonas transparens]|uniref:Uncharacterized protein n=1 Tax=Marinomonas transparens TaxID=2795388 RepID=A0A934JX62_9GAMM|nr:hypothetical protein [Marinomonas transparens]MBJ7540021.1 hypothetical protein [Marinomonas transparens]
MTKIAFTTLIKQALNKLSSTFKVLMISNPLSKLPTTAVGGASHVDWSGCDL